MNSDEPKENIKIKNLLKTNINKDNILYKISCKIDSSTNSLKKLTGYYDKEDREDKEDNVLAKDFFNIID